jgi:hypothetical protein
MARSDEIEKGVVTAKLNGEMFYFNVKGERVYFTKS